jgi:hypothetical protein
MNDALSEIEGRMIAASVATKEKALLTLKAARRPSVIARSAPTLVLVPVLLGLSGLALPFWPRLIVSTACIISFASVAFAWRVQRQLWAIIDLLLIEQEQKR